MGLRYRDIPIIADGSEVLGQQDGVCYVYGKATKATKKRGRRQASAFASEIREECDMHYDDLDDEVLWTKKSIFLSYHTGRIIN